LMSGRGAEMIVWIVVASALLALAVAATVWLARGWVAPGWTLPQLLLVNDAPGERCHLYVLGEIEREKFEA
jgi:hypothetical protein